jgi:hypothetical protein
VRPALFQTLRAAEEAGSLASPEVRAAVAGASAGELDGALLKAAQAGALAAVDLLLGAGAAPGAANAQGSSALHIACFWGCEAVARRLLEAGAAVGARDPRGQTCLQRAVEGDGGLDVARLLLAAGVPPLTEEECRLLRATRPHRLLAIEAVERAQAVGQ